MYTGSFAASLKGIAYTRGFVIFTRVRVNKHIPPFTGEGFLTLSPSPDLYVAVPAGWECQPVSPTAGKQRFDSVTQHNDASRIAWKNSPYDNLPRYSRLSMK